MNSFKLQMLSIRIPANTNYRLGIKSAEAGKSKNKFVLDLIAKALNGTQESIPPQ